MESEKCIICKLPVSESDDAWFIGWLHSIGCWQHETCTNDDLNDAECADQDQVTDWTDPETSGITDSILDASAQDHVVNDIGESTFEEGSNTRLDSLHDESAVRPTYEVVEASSKRSGWRLIDNLGFAYNVQSMRTCAMYWQCTVHPKGNQCKATVIERDGVFTQGLSIHNHPPQSGTLLATKIVKKVKERAVEEKFKSAKVIMEEARYSTNVQDIFIQAGKWALKLKGIQFCKTQIARGLQYFRRAVANDPTLLEELQDYKDYETIKEDNDMEEEEYVAEQMLSFGAVQHETDLETEQSEPDFDVI